MTKPLSLTHDPRSFQAPSNRRFTDAEVADIRRAVAAGAKVTDLCRVYHVARGTLYRLVNGESYSTPALPYPTYAEDQARIDRLVAERAARSAHDEAILLYRREKEKRANRAEPLMLEAKAAFARELQRAEQAKFGGRPRKDGSPPRRGNVFAIPKSQKRRSA